jgi:hypothetical protein
MTIKSADDLIVHDEQKKLGIETAKPQLDKAIEAPIPDTPTIPPVEEQVEAEELPIAAESVESATEEDAPVEKAEAKEDEDAYGNKITPAKMYTAEEVQEMIRDRLKRGHHADQPQIQEAAKDFKPDPESEDSWETQLGGFIENKVAEIENKKQQKVWQEKELSSQAEFESKFTTGMSKYGDFHKVVGGKPVSGSMMMATRSMDDPAAFLYAACKQQPAEIERISKIPDPAAQLVEMGRLEERMKKARVLSRAPAPAKRMTGDITDNLNVPKHNIDALIHTHAKDKMIYNKRLK